MEPDESSGLRSEPGEFKGSKLGIRPRMIAIISSILLFSLGGMIGLATYFFREDNKLRVQEGNLNLSRVIADNIRNSLVSLVRSSTLSADLLLLGNREVEGRLWLGEKDLLYLAIVKVPGNGPILVEKSVTNDSILKQFGVNPGLPRQLLESRRKALEVGARGITAMVNLSPGQKLPLLGISVPYEKPDRSRRALVLILRSEAFQESFQSSGITETFLVDLEGNLLLHPDQKRILGGANLSGLPIIQAMQESSVKNGQIRYLDSDGQAYLGAFRTLPEAGVGVISTVPENLAYEEVYNIQRRNIYLLIVVLNLAVFIVFFFARGITRPIRRLADAAREVERGNYGVRVRTRSRDELGLLTHSFNSMTRGLRERENLRESFGRFVNRDVAEMSMSGQLKLGGERKECAVFFSDIRGFTTMSEKMDPAGVVDFLNEYFSAMVSCVNQNEGSVDKFIGDAIMAVWGTLRPVENPSYQAIIASLQMRQALMELNERRKTQRKNPIHIGCGINYGPVIAGQIGSDEKLEYTVIGDTVNLASRTESLSKVYGADILITENVLREVQGLFRIEKMERLKVKGKSQAITIYAVLGMKDDSNAPGSVKELQSLLGLHPTEPGRRSK